MLTLKIELLDDSGNVLVSSRIPYNANYQWVAAEGNAVRRGDIEVFGITAAASWRDHSLAKECHVTLDRQIALEEIPAGHTHSET